MSRVQLTRQATRYLEEPLPENLQQPVVNALTDLEFDPEAAGNALFSRLKGLWSARVGSYRVIYSTEGSRRSPKVIIRAIKHRSTAYQRGRSR